jgi:DNA-binding transcriptional regulator GbsR (MarR family)
MMTATPVPRFVEDFAVAMATIGFPRMPARVFALLLAAPEETLTARDLAERLEVSPAAISGAVRYLAQIDLVRRTRRTGERVDRFGLGENIWEPVIHAELRAYGPLIELCTAAVASEELDENGRRRVAMTGEFLAFMADELPQMLERWRARRGA